MRAPLPIFVISYNRGAFLERVIASYRRLNRPVHIVVHDNGSDDPSTLSVLDRLESVGCVVCRRQKIRSADDLNRTNETVQAYFRRAEASRYVVTDCDIDLSIANPDALDMYGELLDVFDSVECVGPMLRIKDVPESYPLFRSVMTRHISQFWHRKPEWIDTDRGSVATIECSIDTTFALHRAGEAFRRQKRARRVYHPYEATHLDWYRGPADYFQDGYFDSSSSGISHWHNRCAHEEHVREKLEYDRFIYVDEDEQGRLTENIRWFPSEPGEGTARES